MRAVSCTCDWCHEATELEDVDPVELGWTSVEKFDTIREEVVELDFCSAECVVSFFNE